MTYGNRDLGDGRVLMVLRNLSGGYQVSVDGFIGNGMTEELAIDDLLAVMKRYCEASTAFSRSLAPGGALHGKLQQIEQLVTAIEAKDPT